MQTFMRSQHWSAPDEFSSADIVHLHSMTGFMGLAGLKKLLSDRPKVFWTAHNPWLFTGGCVAYAGCDNYQTGCTVCPLLKTPLGRWANIEWKAKSNFLREYSVQPIANSEWMAAMMRRSPFFEGIEIPIVPPIVDAVFFQDFTGPIKVDDADMLLGDGLPPPIPRKHGGRQLVVGLAARAVTNAGKGIQDFFNRLPATGAFVEDVSYIVIGEGKVDLPPNVACRWAGLVQKPEILAHLYHSMDLFVSPSRMETFGMAILEAQACGTPVVAFSAGGTPEAVFSGPSRLVANGNFEALFQEIEGARDCPLSDGAELSPWVEMRHSSAAIASRQLEIYSNATIT
jgi:glycosyltransferase involved in cell wall biosynthesis